MFISTVKKYISSAGTIIVNSIKEKIKNMTIKATVVWMHPGFEERERYLVAKGYVVRKIQSGNSARLYDDVPDMIIYSEELLSENSLLFRINEFFPDTIGMSIGMGKNVLQEQESASMGKLIDEIKAIDAEE